MTDGNFFSTLKARFDEARDCAFLTALDGASLTYGEIDARSAMIAGALAAAGAKPGDRICVQVEKSADNVALYLAALRSGLVYVPLNTAYTADEIAYFLGDAAPQILICDPQRRDELAKIGADGVQLMTLGAGQDGSLPEAAATAEPLEQIAARHADDLAVILYTSGTTGRSKGAMLSHENLRANAAALHEVWGFQSGDVLLHALPIFHIHGLFVALHPAMLNASEVLFLPKFDAGHVKKALSKATVMMGVPTFYTRLLADETFSAKDCADIRLFTSGSAPLTPETFQAFRKRTGHKILERYGMSEAGIITSNPLDGERIAGTVGYALPGVEIRIAGADGAPLPNGEAGGVEVRGSSLFKGYWRMPDKTAAEFNGDWFMTGDVGVMDDTGRLSIVGRAKDLIIAGGYNIYPKEIEQLLDRADAIAESAVIGAPHRDMGEGVVAVLAPARGAADAPPLGADELSALVSSLARFKQPRKFFWVDELPRNAMGKVQKQALREQFKTAFD